MIERTIIISECVFGGRFVVTFEPRSIALPSMEFRTHADALACAKARQDAHGWNIIDKTGEDHHEIHRS